MICSLEQSEVERMGLNFRLHQSRTHDPLKYIKWWVTLKAKGRENLSQLEELIWDSWERNDFTWIPNGASQRTQRIANQDQGNSGNSLENFKANLALVINQTAL